MTVDHALHLVRLGEPQRVTHLDFALRSSLGENFAVSLPDDAELTDLQLNGKAIPVRTERDKVVVPLRPGAQNVSMHWRTKKELSPRGQTDAVSFPVETANLETRVQMPSNRWVLWACGPQRGPAVRFWGEYC